MTQYSIDYYNQDDLAATADGAANSWRLTPPKDGTQVLAIFEWEASQSATAPEKVYISMNGLNQTDGDGRAMHTNRLLLVYGGDNFVETADPDTYSEIIYVNGYDDSTDTEFTGTIRIGNEWGCVWFQDNMDLINSSGTATATKNQELVTLASSPDSDATFTGATAAAIVAVRDNLKSYITAELLSLAETISGVQASFNTSLGTLEDTVNGLPDVMDSKISTAIAAQDFSDFMQIKTYTEADVTGDRNEKKAVELKDDDGNVVSTYYQYGGLTLNLPTDGSEQLAFFEYGPDKDGTLNTTDGEEYFMSSYHMGNADGQNARISCDNRILLMWKGTSYKGQVSKMYDAAMKAIYDQDGVTQYLNIYMNTPEKAGGEYTELNWGGYVMVWIDRTDDDVGVDNSVPGDVGNNTGIWMPIFLPDGWAVVTDSNNNQTYFGNGLTYLLPDSDS